MRLNYRRKAMLIKYQNLTIRNAGIEDASLLCKWWSDGKIMAHAGFPDGIKTSEEVIAQSLLKDTDEVHRRLILMVDEVAIGEMNVRNMGDHTAEIGIKICDFSRHNQGLGKKFLSMLIQFLFEEMGYKRIILDTNVKNLAAQRVYGSLGFTNLGVRENAWEDQRGELQSSIDYQLIPEDFISFCR